eukprot:3307878-Prymnesium_polylepis.1
MIKSKSIDPRVALELAAQLLHVGVSRRRAAGVLVRPHIVSRAPSKFADRLERQVARMETRHHVPVEVLGDAIVVTPKVPVHAQAQCSTQP